MGKAVMSSGAPEPQGGLTLDVLGGVIFRSPLPWNGSFRGAVTVHQWSGTEEGGAHGVTCPTSLFADRQLRP